MSILYQNVAYTHLNSERRFQWKNRGTVRSLLQHGNFGFGATKNLSNEIVVLDGTAYAIDREAKIFLPEETEECSLTSITQFNASDSFELQDSLSYDEFLEHVRQRVPQRSNPYAIKCEGRFKLIKGRSIYAVENFAEDFTQDDWPRFEFSNIEGTMVGFIFPEYMNPILAGNQSHFHFIDQSKTCGCHVFEFEPTKVKVETMPITKMVLNFDEF